MNVRKLFKNVKASFFLRIFASLNMVAHWLILGVWIDVDSVLFRSFSYFWITNPLLPTTCAAANPIIKATI